MNWSLSWGRVAWVLRMESRNCEMRTLFEGREKLVMVGVVVILQYLETYATVFS